MISKIAIQNFKSLRNIELECSNLNLLSGLNGMGKSSVLQALLLLRQSHSKGHLLKDGLTLKGDLVNIGTGRDALFRDTSDKEEITFSLFFSEKGDTINYKWIFGYETNKDIEEFKYSESDVLPFAEGGNPFEIESKLTDPEPLPELSGLPLFNIHFQYLNAERWVKNLYERSDFQVVQNRNLGKNGEFTPHYLVHFGSKTSEWVNDKLLYPNTEIKTLDFQVSAWMNEISPGTNVNTERITGMDAIKLSYGKEEFTPTNVGFGITYILPVIVALLSAKPGDILIIENPESHLHPQGQSAIGRLMGLCAQQGVQIFVESHSDHILNGICVAIHKGHLKSDMAKFYFLHKKNNESFSTIYDVKVNQSGRIDDSNLRETGVVGFFDQINKDMETILFTDPIG